MMCHHKKKTTRGEISQTKGEGRNKGNMGIERTVKGKEEKKR